MNLKVVGSWQKPLLHVNCCSRFSELRLRMSVLSRYSCSDLHKSPWLNSSSVTEIKNFLTYALDMGSRNTPLFFFPFSCPGGADLRVLQPSSTCCTSLSNSFHTCFAACHRTACNFSKRAHQSLPNSVLLLKTYTGPGSLSQFYISDSSTAIFLLSAS